MSRAELEMHLYSGAQTIASNVIDSAVASLRRKLAERGLDDLIRTRRGIGYEFQPKS
jgi:DNA-binding response OmpR family regulator